MKNLILFASGQGSNVRAIAAYFSKTPDVRIGLIVSNNAQAPVLDFAKKENIPTLLVDKQSFSATSFVEKLQSYHPDLVILAGFLWKIPESVVQAFPGKIINIHPALLPKYGGKGMYGVRVHEAVLAAKDQESGITIHFVNEHYDEGNTILQAFCKVEKEDNLESIQEKIHQLEHYYFPRTIEFLLLNKG